MQNGLLTFRNIDPVFHYNNTITYITVCQKDRDPLHSPPSIILSHHMPNNKQIQKGAASVSLQRRLSKDCQIILFISFYLHRHHIVLWIHDFYCVAGYAAAISSFQQASVLQCFPVCRYRNI